MWTANLERIAAKRGWSDGDVRYLTRKLSHPCQTCGARPGEWCRTRSGRVLTGLDSQHRTRR